MDHICVEVSATDCNTREESKYFMYGMPPSSRKTVLNGQCQHKQQSTWSLTHTHTLATPSTTGHHPNIYSSACRPLVVGRFAGIAQSLAFLEIFHLVILIIMITGMTHKFFINNNESHLVCTCVATETRVNIVKYESWSRPFCMHMFLCLWCGRSSCYACENQIVCCVLPCPVSSSHSQVTI